MRGILLNIAKSCEKECSIMCLSECRYAHIVLLYVYKTSREAKRRGLEGGETGSVWLNEQEIRALAAPLCEEDLTHRGDDIVLGEHSVGAQVVDMSAFLCGCVCVE